MLPCYKTLDANPKVTDQEKHYYMMVTFPGHGARAVAAMASGSRLKTNAANRGNFKFWFEQLVELGIGTAEDEEMLKAITWKVRPFHSTVA